jgi:hypothetical protein
VNKIRTKRKDNNFVFMALKFDVNIQHFRENARKKELFLYFAPRHYEAAGDVFDDLLS